MTKKKAAASPSASPSPPPPPLRTDTNASDTLHPPSGHESLRHRPSRAESDAEVDELRARVWALQAAAAHQEATLSGLTEQDWATIIHRGQQAKARFTHEMDALLADLQALCDQAHRQRQSSQNASNSDRADANASHSTSAISPRSRSLAAPSHALTPRQIHRKEFSWRESPLTTFFRTSREMMTIYNMWVAVLILFAMKIILRDLFTAHDSGSDSVSIWMFLRTFGKLLSHVFPVWWLMFAFHALLLPLMWVWRRGRIQNFEYSLLYVLHQAVFIFGFAYVIVRLDLPVASSLILLCEQVRMLMKAHSFWRETLRIRLEPFDQAAQKKFDAQPIAAHLAHSEENTTFLSTFALQLRAFALFHFAPTLIYRNVYPRTRYIRWKFVTICLAEVLGAIFYIYVIFANFDAEFEETAHSPGDLKQLVVSLFNSVLPGIGVYLLTFFGLLHAWMNMFAELTRFADRTFYLDWWNTTSFSSYYRKWNMIVHDCLYAYIYTDLVQVGVSRGAGFFLTFLVSAIVHEYIISMALQFFYPVLFVMFLVFGVAFVYLTKFVGTAGRGWNTFFWANLIIGNGMLMVLYSREYYARQPQQPAAPPKWPFNPDSWLPWSWQPFVYPTATTASIATSAPMASAHRAPVPI